MKAVLKDALRPVANDVTAARGYLTTDDGTGAAGDEYTGLDQFGRVIDQNWYNTSTDTSMVNIEYGYDDDSNVLYQNNTLESTQSELFAYDGLSQLTSYKQGTLSDDNTEIASPNISETWGYDPLGNHLTDSTTTTGTVAITCTFNYDNQITSISSGTTPTYDADGNMTTDQSGLIYTYNAWGQEVDVYSGDTLRENYTYDGFGDRMTNTVYTDDVGTTTNFFNSTAGQVLEEQAAGTGYYTTRYVWSVNYVNQMVSRDTDTSGTGLTASGSDYARLWPVADANFNTVALVAMSDDTATVVERYSYDPFGTVTYMNGSYTVEGGSGYEWVYLFQGGRLDTITGLIHFDARNVDPGTGAWTSEDPLGFPGGNVDLDGFENDNPVGGLDPSGLDRISGTNGGDGSLVWYVPEKWGWRGDGQGQFLGVLVTINGEQFVRRSVNGQFVYVPIAKVNNTTGTWSDTPGNWDEWFSDKGVDLSAPSYKNISIQNGLLPGHNAFAVGQQQATDLANQAMYWNAGAGFMVGGVSFAPLQNASQAVTTRVGQLQAAIPAAQRGRITMAVAVVEDSNGVRSILVSSSEGAYVRGPVRPVVESMGAQVVGGTGHAEANIIAHAQANNLRVIDIGATRPVCVPCQDVINPTGANISTPLRPR